jgi:tetratricopeptide (TPR) repeat protein
MKSVAFPRSFSARAGLIAVSGLAVLLASCASLETGGGGSKPGMIETDTWMTGPEPASNQIDPIYEIMVGEIAGHRGQLDLAAEHYLRAAQVSSDPEIAERAVRIGIFAKEEKRSLQAALRWLELEPDNLEAHQVVAALYIRNGLADPAIEHLEKVIEAKPGDERQGFMLVFALLGRESNTEVVMQVMNELVARHDDNPYAYFALGHLALRADRPEEGLAAARRARQLDPGLSDAYVLEARALVELGRMDEALEGLGHAVTIFPDDQELRLAYARMLVEARAYDKARVEFEALHRLAPDDPDLLHTLALLSIEAKRLDDAERYLKQLRATGKRIDDAHYYLGRIADTRRQYEEAIGWYNLVLQGEYRLDAQVRIGQMLAKLGDLDAARDHLARLREQSSDPATNIRLFLAEGEILRDAREYVMAMSVYDRALTEFPNNTDLLYARALTAEKIDRVDWLERDIHSILEREPDNAHALNALGYTLADRTNRYEEAMGYIQRALELKPDEPAIIDSMGWINYRMGNYDQALKYLRRAVSLLQDPEIAAHLGEVLWVSGQHDEARKVWERALEHDPDSTILLDVMNRFLP